MDKDLSNSELKSEDFLTFALTHLAKKYKGKEKRELEKEITKKIGERKSVLAETFYIISKLIGLDIDKTCVQLLVKDRTFPDLNLFPTGANKLNNFLDTYSKELKEIAASAGIKYNRLVKLNAGDYDNLYPNDVNGIAIAFGVKPSQLFEYFYGEGERPVPRFVAKKDDSERSDEALDNKDANIED